MKALVLWASCLVLGLVEGARKQCGRTLSNQGLIVSSDYLPPVANGETCSWTLQAISNQHIALSFDDFDIGKTASLSIYNGVDQTSASLLTTYFDEGPVGTVVPFGSNKVTLVFKNGYVTQPSRAFGLSFASVIPPSKSSPGDPFTDCGGDLVGGGKFSSPGNPGWYPNDATCQWTLTAGARGTGIKIAFDSVDLENNFDFVIVYDGATKSAATNFRKLTGSLAPFVLEAGTSVIVTFNSDSSIGKSGFSATFSTVVPVLPPDVVAACSASCPPSVTPDPGALCYAHDDPHMRTFDGKTYELQKEGVFYLYRHDNAPIWVQAVFQQCPNGYSRATCSCAVAVRYWNEVFVVDRCLTVASKTRPNRIYKSGNYSMMAITKVGVRYIVTLPNGLSVDINAAWAWIGTVELKTAVGDKNVVRGVCGLYNSNPADDATFRLGYDPQTIKDAWMSWRVPEGETLFAPALPPYSERISNCDCAKVKNDNRLPDGVLWTNLQQVPNTELSDSSKINITKDPNPGVITYPNNPWPINWTADKAAAFCNTYIKQRPSIAQCQKVAGAALDVGPMFTNCIRDIYLTGDSKFATTALEGAKSRCEEAIKDKPEAEKRPILDMLCPNDCSSQGTCVRGVCQCQSGFYGADCSVDLSAPPVLRQTTAVTNCHAAQLLNNICYQENVFGETFYNVIANNPVCLVSAKKTTSTSLGLVTADLPLLRQPGTLVSPSTVTCPLPIVPGPYNVPFSVNYTISVSNDNSKFSNTVQSSRGFVPSCGGAIDTAGTITSPNYPASYYNGANCKWILTAPAGKIVQLNFNVFSIAYKTESLLVLDNDQTIYRFTGSQPAGKRYAFGKSVTLIFNSGMDAPLTGFSITFNSLPLPQTGPCGGQLTGSGSIVSPGSPGNYPNNVHCLWTLTADAGKLVNLHFNAFNLEDAYDYLYVILQGRQSIYLTGNTLPQDFTIQSPAYLVFRSDDTINFTGFNIDFTSKSETC